MKKRILSILVVLCLAVALPVVAFAAEEPALPEAIVEKLGATTYTGDYLKYDLVGGSGLSSTNGDIAMQIAMQFTAKDTAEQAAANYYANYTTDFFIEINGLSEDAVVADGCYLAGYYATFGAWVKIPLNGFPIENGKVYPVITSAGFDFKYTDICGSVGSFTCGIYFSDAFLDANPDIEVKLSLGLSENKEAALNTDFVVVEEYTYDGADLGIAVAEVGGTKYATLAEAIAVGGEVKLLTDVELDAPIVIEKGQKVVLDLGTNKISYTSTVSPEAMITNKGTLTINGEEGSEIFYNYVGEADPAYKKGNYTIANGGKLTVNGGKIHIATLRGHAKYPIDNNSTTGDAVLVINGGYLYNYNTSAIRQFCNSTTNKNSVTINGGVIEGYCAIWVQNPSAVYTVPCDLTINGGEIRTTAAAYVNGTAELKDVASCIYCTTEGGAWTEDSFIALNGGIFNENVALTEQAPAEVTTKKNATFNGYVDVPAVEPTLIVDENNYLVMTDTKEKHINHRLTVYFLGDETVEDIYDEAALKAIDASAKTYWGKDEINNARLKKSGNYVLVLNYNNGVGSKKETVCVEASIVVPELTLPTVEVKDNKVVATAGDEQVANYRAVVYYLGNQTAADIYDEAALKAIDADAKTYWGLTDIKKIQLLEAGNYVIQLHYNVGKGTKQTVATATTVALDELTLEVVNGKLVAADPNNAYVHHRAVVYYLGDETVEDIYDEAALKAIDTDAKTYWDLKHINKVNLTESGNYVVLLHYNLPDSPKLTIAVSVTI